MISHFHTWMAGAKNPGQVFRLAPGLAGLALLSACASSPHAVTGYSTNYYISHAEGNYTPPGPPDDPWGPYINIASSRFDVPAPWIREVMHVESGGHEYIGGQLTVSSAGAMGLMQLEPETYQEMAARYGLGHDPFNPYDNIMAGTAYIHEMYAVYGSPGFLAAYDAGPGRLNSYMNGDKPLPDETVNYVAMIAPGIQGYYPAHRSAADELALNTEPEGVSGGLLPPGFSPEAPAPFSPAPQPAPAPVEVAAVEPSMPASSAVYSAPVYTAPQPAPEPPPPRPSFSIIPAAMADTPPPPPPPPSYESAAPVHYAAAMPGGWAIQVGAYDTSENARAALGIAELSAVQVLMAGHPMVVSVHAQGRLKYRARFTGLAHEAAEDACGRLSGGPTGCIILSPEAQY